MTSPSGLLAVLVRVVASEKHTVLVGLQDGIERAYDVGDGTVTEVELVKTVVSAVGVGVLLGHGDQLPGVGQSLAELTSLGGVARRVDRDFFDISCQSSLFVDDGARESGGEQGRRSEESFGEHGWEGGLESFR